MLQQTRIEAVINYYNRFMKYLSTIQDLTNVPEDKLLKLWEGLGYYNRARNLKKAAIIIEKQYQGIFPNNYQEMIKLPGIRVYTRFYNDTRNIDLSTTKKEIQSEIEKILPSNSGDFNETLMELGETICIPSGTPRCDLCPLKKHCLAYQEKTYLQLPIKSHPHPKKELKYTIWVLKYHNKYALEKRTETKMLNNLWQFPNLEKHLSILEVKN